MDPNGPVAALLIVSGLVYGAIALVLTLIMIIDTFNLALDSVSSRGAQLLAVMVLIALSPLAPVAACASFVLTGELPSEHITDALLWLEEVLQ